MNIDELKEKCELLKYGKIKEQLTNEQIGEMFLVLIHEINMNNEHSKPKPLGSMSWGKIGPWD